MGSKPSSSVVKMFSFRDGVIVKRPPSNPVPRGFHQRYELTGRLGRGAFATVWSISDALKECSNEDLVVKVIDLREGMRTHSSESPTKLGAPRLGTIQRSLQSTFKATFELSNQQSESYVVSAVEREIDMLRKVSNISYCVRFVDAFLESDFGYIVMERCSISFYNMLLSHADLSERSLVPVANDMFLGLAAIHDLRIIHCDIKPDNYVFHKKDNILKLCDFGLSACVTAEKPLRKGVRGTAPFMSPEMLVGTYGTSTDMWSVGVTIYTILLGAFPYMPSKVGRKSMKEMIKVGIPKPSFCTADGMNPSDVSINFLEKLIDRDPSTRPTAKEALNHAWFKVSSTSRHGTSTLQPLIPSAARKGAFKLPGKDVQDHPLGGIDAILLRRQEVAEPSRVCLARSGNMVKVCSSQTSVGSTLTTRSACSESYNRVPSMPHSVPTTPHY